MAVNQSLPRPCIFCGNDSVRVRINGATGQLNSGRVNVILQCCHPDCLHIIESFSFNDSSSSTPLNVMIDRMLTEYEKRICQGSEFALESEAGIIT